MTHINYARLIGAMLFLLVLCQIPLMAQIATHRSGLPINLQISGHNTSAGYVQKYVLTNTAGVIQYSVATLPFTGVGVGAYKAYAVNYDGMQAAPTLTVGTAINAIGGACVRTSSALPIGVLDCNNTTGTINPAISGQNSGASFTQKYALTDSVGRILQITNTPQYVGLSSGIYNVYAVNYETATGVTGFSVGQLIGSVTGTCVQVSQPLGYVVCRSTVEIAGNGIDDDGDNLIDCHDPDVAACTCTTTSTITFGITGQNTTTGFTTKYVLTDSFGVIKQIVNTPSVSGLTDGKYRIYSINYETATGVTGLTIGQNISGVTGTCVAKSLPLIYKVCLLPSVEIAGNGIDDDGDNLIDCHDPDVAACTCTTTSTITFGIAGHNTTAGFTTKYVLTDSFGVIKQIVNTPSVSGLTDGKYRIYSVNYETATGVTGLTVGQNISGVTGTCVAKSLPLIYKVCLLPSVEIAGNGIDDDGDNLIDCHDPDVAACTCTTTSTITFGISSQNTTAGFTTKYILTDSFGVIKQIVNTPSVSGLIDGKYRIYSVNYQTAMGITGLTVGQNILGVTGTCVAKSLPLIYKICLPTCPTIAGMPNDTAMCSNTLSLVVNGLGSITNEGIKFVYFTTLQTDSAIIYGGTGTTLGTVTNSSLTNNKTTATFNASFPANNTGLPITYHTYALLDPTPTNAGCRPYGHVLVTIYPSVAASTASATTQPTCPIPTGTITVTTPTGIGMTYSINGSTYTNTTGIFTGIASGTYSVTAKNSSGCVSTATSVTINAVPTCGEICNNLIDDDGNGKIDCEDSGCLPCSCTTISNIVYNPPITDPSVNHTKRYVLTNDNGVIQKVSTSPIFLNCPDGQYRVYTVWYIAATYIPPLSMGGNISAVTGTSVVVSLPKLEKVCSPSVQYETRILQKDYDCINKKVTIQVQARAKPSTGTFLMSDANYRFDYNSTQLSNPVIVSQEHFSNIAPSSDIDYLTQTLNGSSEGPTIGTVSLNTVYAGGGFTARTVDSTWQTVSCIQFDKRDTALCYAFRWHDNVEHPSTGMTGIVINGGGSYDSYDVKTGGYYGNLQQCLSNLNCCATLNIKVILEGAYNSTTGLMSTTLNQRGLLPGQTPIGPFAVSTVAGQPYNISPWDYAGTESLTTYPTTVVDWVLVSLRTDSLLATSAIQRKAGLLHSDGHVSFLDSCWSLAAGQKYFVVVEHRNHLGVMANFGFNAQSHTEIDFTIGDGYIKTNPPTTGQKQIGSKWVMLSGDGRKELQLMNFDINFNDQQRWKIESGIFDQYRYSDFNLDADSNFFDSNLWKKNNGRYSAVPH